MAAEPLMRGSIRVVQTGQSNTQVWDDWVRTFRLSEVEDRVGNG